MTSKTFALALNNVLLLAAQIVLPQPATPQDFPPSSTAGIRFEAVRELPESRSPQATGPTIAAIEFRGARRVHQSGLRAVIGSRVGHVYDLETLRRDAEALYSTGRFSNVAWETEMSPAGATVHFVVVERPLIQSIEYQYDDSVTMSEILARFREQRVNLKVEGLFNGDEVGRAAATIEDIVAEKSRKHIRVTPLVESSWPHDTVRITFRAVQKE